MISFARMSAVKAGRELWIPRTEADRAAVQKELSHVLASPHFANSKRYPTFLRYVVERSLAGHAQQLKERTIGFEVFNRPADYDTNADTVVRFTAGEVRKRLALYYHEHDGSEVQILLPIGSYAPEFLHREAEAGDAQRSLAPLPIAEPAAEAPPIEQRPAQDLLEPVLLPARGPEAAQKSKRHYLVPLALFLLFCAAVSALALYLHRASSASSDVDQYWAPLFAEKNNILLGSGGTVLMPQRYPGPTTADRSTEYPFVSMQIVTAIVHITGILDRHGAQYEIRSSPFLTLTDLRERPTVLVGGYNNEWTMRLTSPLRFYFAPDEGAEAILDREHPQVSWHRDGSLPYARADDYALVARFRDPTTDSMIYIVAGIGRNGTEAAAQLVTNPRFLSTLKQQTGQAWNSGNIEAVIKTHVIEGRTGAPSIVAVHTW